MLHHYFVISAICTVVFGTASAADFYITNYGARPNDANLDTTAIQAAIQAASNAGGGRVIVPTGKFISGTLVLPSKVTIRLSSAKTILAGSANLADYAHGCFINATGGNNKRIEGPGVIDGVDCHNPNGEEGFRGPHCIDFANCDGFTASGITIQNSANYALTGMGAPGLTKNIRIQSVKINGGHDGVHLRRATSIIISDCDFRTGDDAIAGGENVNVTVLDCKINSSTNGMRFGADTLTVKRCHFWGPGQYPHRISGNHATDAAYCYFSAKEMNPTIPGDKVLFEDCTVDALRAVFKYQYNGLWQDGQVLKNVTLRNVRATNLNSHEAFKVVGDTARNFNLTLEGVDIGFIPGPQRYCVTLTNFGTCTVKSVTLRNDGDEAAAAFQNGNTLLKSRLLITPSHNGYPLVIRNINSVTDVPAPIVSGSTYKIIPCHATNLRLDASAPSSGSNVRIWADTSNNNQRWKISDTGGGVYEITPLSALTNRLNVSGQGRINGTNMNIESAANSPFQRWYLLEQGDKRYEFVPLGSPFQRMDASNAKKNNGANVQTWADLNENRQYWMLELAP